MTKNGIVVLIADKVDFKNKLYNKRQRRSLYNDKKINKRIHKQLIQEYLNIYIYTYIYENINRHNIVLLYDNTIIVGNFNIWLHHWKDHPDRKSVRKYGNSVLK